jgi:hypothetical protein
MNSAWSRNSGTTATSRDDGLSYGDYPSTALGTGSEQLTVLLFKMLNE